VWALGVVLYELLGGRRPFQDDDREALADKVLRETPAPLRRLNPAVPRRLDEIVMRCLVKEPKGRFPEAKSLAEALRGYRQSRWHRSWPAMAALGAAALIVAAVLYGHQPDQTASRAPEPDQQYLEETARMVARLRENGQIELVSADSAGEPTYRAYDGSTRAVRSEDGLRVRGSSYCGFVELLPEVPFSQFRITAKLRLEARLANGAEWGVYFSHDQARSSTGVQHYFHVLTLAEDRPLAVSVASGEPSWTYQARLCPHLFAETSSPSNPDLVHRDRSWVVPNQPPCVDRQLPAAKDTDPWRTLIIDVTPERDSARCLDCAGQFSLTPIPRAATFAFIARLRQSYPDLAEIPRFPERRSALGVYLREAIGTIGSFKIESRP
jgi:hypothetical protein